MTVKDEQTTQTLTNIERSGEKNENSDSYFRDASYDAYIVCCAGPDSEEDKG